MRRILVENARRKRAAKHGGGWTRNELLDAELAVDTTGDDLFAVDEALTRLAQTEPAKAELVILRFFAGLTMTEAASALDISLATAERYWTFAKSWLYAELAGDA